MEIEKYINLDVLEENISHQPDWYSDNKFDDYLTRINHIKHAGLTALLGDYGSGKSMYLKELQKFDEKNNNNIRIHFDAWQYPDRKQLRDGFVLKLAEELIPKTYGDIKTKIDTGKGPGEILANKLISFLEGVVLKIPAEMGATNIIPGIIVDSLKSITRSDSQPISRVFEYEELLRLILIANDQDKAKNEILSNKTIYIILEDVDRSGEEGLFFLETIKNFIDRHYGELKDCSIFNKMIIICPVASHSRDNNFSRYLKVFSKYDFFVQNKMLDVKKFVDSVFLFNQEVKDIFYVLISQSLKKLESNYRILKFIIRHIIKEYTYRTKFLSEDLDLERFLFLGILGYKLRETGGEGITYNLSLPGDPNDKVRILRQMITFKFANTITNTIDDKHDISGHPIDQVTIKQVGHQDLQLHAFRRNGPSISLVLHVPPSYSPFH